MDDDDEFMMRAMERDAYEALSEILHLCNQVELTEELKPALAITKIVRICLRNLPG